MRPLILSLALLGVGFAQIDSLPDQSLVRYLQPGASADHPLDLVLATSEPFRGLLDLSHLSTTLTPVPHGQGRLSTATLSSPTAPAWTFKNTRYQARVPLTLTTDAPSGVYALNVTLPSGQHITTSPLAYNREVPKAPPLHPGATFLNLGGGPYTRAVQPVAFRDLNNRLFTLTALNSSGADFTVEGLSEPVHWSGTGEAFPGLFPIVDDPSLNAYRQQFEGQTAWLYGGLDVSCAPSQTVQLRLRASPLAPMKIKRLLRLARPLWSGAQQYSGQAASDSDVIALTPIAVQLERPPSAEVFAGMGSDLDAVGDPPSLLNALDDPANDAACQTLTLILADTWSLPRTLSAVPPSGRVPQEVPKDVRGLDRWQYAWLFGFPSATFGTRDDLLKLGKWEYVNIPFVSTVTFDQHGKVRAVHVPELP